MRYIISNFLRVFSNSFINFPEFFIDTKIVQDIFACVDKTINKPQNGILNIVFVPDEHMQALNKTYRGIDTNTDVLSFHYFEDFSLVKPDEIAGELVFSESKIELQAVEYGLGEEKEFYKLLIHSLLHILGYDHEEENDYKIMQAFENQIWQEIFEK